MSGLADAAERTRAIHERARNVIVDAGAGTGKTTLLVDRMLHLIAPPDDGLAIPLDRLAAITFTRKAAGELKLRLREALLRTRGAQNHSDLRKQRLQQAMDVLDNAQISTVHSFADRLLRLRPADARLSPEYQIAEDTGPYVEETFRGLLDAAERGTLGAHLHGDDAELAAEATETLHLVQAAGLRLRSQDEEYFSRLGLDALIDGMIETRDRQPLIPAPRAPDLDAVRRHADELSREVQDLKADNLGARTLRRLSRHALGIAVKGDLSESLRRAVDWQREYDRVKNTLQRGDHFGDDRDGWAAFRWLKEGVRGSGARKEERPHGPLANDVVGPLMGWLAERLIRMRKLVLERYAEVKRAHAVLDQVDLLIALRDLLERDLDARAFYQARFDHILVDEFQDTDPLQAEIVLYLCEDGAHASGLTDLTLAPGKLTIVGDPKQSIYRFRRADIAMYAEVCARLRRGPVCEAQLTVNFRSASSILHWVNDAFDALLGKPGEGPRYDPARGAVCNMRLAPAHEDGGEPCVHVLPFGHATMKADAARNTEGEALACYLRYLVEDSGLTIRDPHEGGRRRKARYGDIAVMMVTTQTVHHLTAELDVVGVPHVVRGGTLFMNDPLHRQFVLGLRGLVERDDGAARAALLRPPFFAVTLADLVRAKLHGDGGPALAAADAILADLRRTRLETTPGETARRVLEQTGFGTWVASGINGAQRLARLYELCLTLDTEALKSGLDFDGVTALARSWIDAPARIEAPLPIDADAVQVITAHQAKGLEWPIVALWDGRAVLRGYLPRVALFIDPLSGRWALQLDGLAPDRHHRELLERERGLLTEERKRVAYVAATRARDLLIVPEAGAAKEGTIAGQLVLSASGQPHTRVSPYLGDGHAWWRSERGVSVRPLAPRAELLVRDFRAAAQRARAPRWAPAGVSSVAHAAPVEAETPARRLTRAQRTSRHGPLFGATVHRALELLLTGAAPHADAAVRAAARELGLLDDAVASLARTRLSLAEASARPPALEAGIDEASVSLAAPVFGSREASVSLSGPIAGIDEASVSLAGPIAGSREASVSLAPTAVGLNEAPDRPERAREPVDLLAEALHDVHRAEAALRESDLLAHPRRLEYPVAGALAPDTLLTGYVDLLIARPAGLVVIDFKTDAPPRTDASAAYPGYVAQVAAYARLLAAAGLGGGKVQSALLFTADGSLHWT